MLRRIILIVAILAALVAGVLNFTVVKDKITTLTNDRNDQRTQKETFHTQLNQTKKVLAQTQATLADTQQQLTTAVADRDSAVHKLDAEITKNGDLTTKLAKANSDRDTAQAQLAAYTSTGKSPQQVMDLDKVLKQDQNAIDVANDENALLSHTVARLQNQVYELLGSNVVVTLPAGLKGVVMAVDPKWKFIVLNIGDKQGVLPEAEMLISRNGTLVGKVVVRSVQKDHCIANLVPGWQLGEIIEGDQAIPAHPAS
jgi:hypothetical protein